MRALLVLALLLATPAALAAPEQVHLGLRDADPLRGMTVSWVETDPLASATLTLTGPDGAVEVEGRRIDGPTPGIVYEATLPPLVPGAEYAYSIGERSFPLRAPTDGTSLRVGVLGDMGTTREAGAAVDAFVSERPDLVLHAGDVSYAGGDPRIWKAWFDLVEPVAASAPWLPALGNHEGDVLGVATDDAAVPDPAEQAVFRQRFPQPEPTFWYSFDWGGVHFVALDTFSQLQMPAEEVAWLEQDLAAAADANWIVAYFHEPPDSSNLAHGSSPRAYDAFADVLERAGVDLVITAHDHGYERSYAMRGGHVVSRENVTAKGNGTVYVVTGGGGAELYPDYVEPAPEWSAVRKALHHVLVLDITKERIEGRVVDTTGGGFTDEFAIARAAPPTPSATTPAPTAPLLALLLAGLAIAARRRG